MNMGKLPLIIAGLSVAASVVVTVAIEQHWADRQTSQKEALKEQAAQIAQAKAENALLTTAVAKGATAPALSPEQFRGIHPAAQRSRATPQVDERNGPACGH